jgi:hypothetical protein
MGLVDFLLDHGGGPGAIARRQAKLYRKLTQEHPSATPTDVLTMMYVSRAEAGANLTGYKGERYRKFLGSDPASVAQFRNTPKLTIRDLVYRIIDAKHTNPRIIPFEIEMKIERTIVQALDSELPGWRSIYR